MHARLAALKRLMSLYGNIEEMHSAGLERAMLAVQEADQAIAAEVPRKNPPRPVAKADLAERLLRPAERVAIETVKGSAQ